MADQRQLVKYYVLVLLAVIGLFTVVYSAGMSVFEGRPRGLIHSLEVVTQTFTTTGYGQDAPWQSTEMKLLVVLMQVSSTVLLFAALPVLVVPLMEEMLTLSAPTETTGRADHVVVCGHGADAETLVEIMTARDIEYVVVEPDRDYANELHETGVDVVHADPESPEALADVDAAAARAIVADTSDESNLSIVMAAAEVAPEVPTYSIAEDPAFASYHRHAGADEVFSPRTLLGRGLANQMRSFVSADLSGAAEIGEDFDIGEFPVRPDSQLCGQTVAEAEVGSRTGVTVIGALDSGQFRHPPFPDLRLDEHTVLLCAGREEQLARLERLTNSEVSPYQRGSVILAGSGVVGSTVREALEDSTVSLTTLDLADGPHVDVVGDATDPVTLRNAGIEDAGSVVLALDDDTTTLITIFVIQDIAPDVEVIARADQRENVGKFYRAGADYVLALATVSGRLLASAILDEEVASFGDRLQVVRRSATPFAGRTLEDVALPERTGCLVVAIEHLDDRVSVNPGKWTELGAREHLVVTGLEENIERFDEYAADQSNPRQ